MPNRTSGFLQPAERAYLDKEGIYRYLDSFGEGKSGGRQAKSRIQNNVATVPNLQILLISLYSDLNAIQNLQRTDPKTWKKWESETLPAVTQELEWLRDTFDRMLTIAERDDFRKEREELEEAFAHLYEGEYHPRAAFGTGVTGHSPPEVVQKSTSKELSDRFETLETRTDGVESLLRREELSEILSYIAKNGRCELPAKKIGGSGEYWSKVASEMLVPELVEKTEMSQTHREYEITEHGRAVLECWIALSETTAVAREREVKPESSERECVRAALKLHDKFLPVDI